MTQRTRALAAMLFALVVGVGAAKPAAAYTPESPEVRRLIDKAKGYLAGKSDDRLGGKCLLALVFLKDGEPGHASVRAALAACEEAKRKNDPGDVYSNGIALIFLCELDAKRYRTLAKYFLQKLEARQKGHGGWGYDERDTGDTSQTQYGTLGIWEAYRNGLSVNGTGPTRCLDWVIRTQDPSGGWGYQGRPAKRGDRIEQDAVRHSMVVAGMSSLLVCADLFGLLQPNADKASEQGNPLPTGFRDADESAASRRKKLSAQGVNQRAMFAALRDGQTWFDERFTVVDKDWNMYYLYSIERFKSFEELLSDSPEEEPEWYNAGVKFLSGSQEAGGSWRTRRNKREISTAFATLFLLRSTQKSLKRTLGDGVMVSGRGAPVALARKKGLNPGGLLTKATSSRVTDMLAMLDSGEADRVEALASDPAAFVGGPIDAESARRLQQLARSGDPGVRLLSVRALGKRRKLDDAPTLLYALTDPDRRVVLAARDSLRRLSRRFEGFGLPDSYDQRQQFEAVAKWKEWYLSFRPNAVIDL